MPKARQTSTRTLKAQCVKPTAPSGTRQRQAIASRALALNQTESRTSPPAARAPADLAREVEAILGILGVGKIWPEENTDDEDSSKEPTFPCHARRTLQARRARQRVRRRVDKISAGRSPEKLKKHPCVLEELGVRGSTAESYRGGVHSIIKWADSHYLALVENDAVDRALRSFMTNCPGEGRMSWAADRVIAGLMFQDRRCSRTGTCGTPWALLCLKGFPKAPPENRDKLTLCALGLE